MTAPVEKICSKCRKLHCNRGRYCLPCHAAYMRKWRKTHPLNEEHKKRDNARSIASVYKRRGLLVPMPCQSCGNNQAEMHHPDHELPRHVIWLCRPCHLGWHARWRQLVKDAFASWIKEQREKHKIAA